MAAHVCIFEDDRFSDFLPLVHFRPVFDLRCGIFTLREKIARAYPGASISLACRTELAPVVRNRSPKIPINTVPGSPCLFVNGRIIADSKLAKKIPLASKQNIVYTRNGQIAAVFAQGELLQRIIGHLPQPLSLEMFDGLPRVETDVEMASYPWDLVHNNGDQIRSDYESIVKAMGKKPHIRGTLHPGVHILGKKHVVIGEGSVLKPGTVIDAEEGPVYIGKNVQVLPQAVITGPAAIMDSSLVKAGAQIYGNTTIGPVCKVGGEIEGSIVHGYANKQHAGFLGHSYLGEWVNLGADTNTSDLKNNYGTVKVQMADRQIDTGLSFVGLTMGDHSKSAINSMFNTGTVVGVCSNIFSAGFPPKFVPSFTWGDERPVEYDIDKALGVARKVVARRNVEFTDADEALFRTVFAQTGEDRRRFGIAK